MRGGPGGLWNTRQGSSWQECRQWGPERLTGILTDANGIDKEDEGQGKLGISCLH